MFRSLASTLNGTLGSGGRTLNLATVNGGIHLRKSQQAGGAGLVPGVGLEPTLSLRKEGF